MNDNQYDPLENAIYQRENTIKEETSLKQKSKTINRIAVVTSLILVCGVIIGLVRILLQFFENI